MKFGIARFFRLVGGMVLPVPLFVTVFYFSYFYSSYNGFDPESGSYLTSKSDMLIARMHLRTDIISFVLMGYLFMGLPSVLYSCALEFYRRTADCGFRGYVGLGVVIAVFSAFIAVGSDIVLTDGILESGFVVLVAALVGGGIPSMFCLVERLGQKSQKREQDAAPQIRPRW